MASGKAIPMRVARGPLGIPLRRCRGLRPCVESVPEPEDSSPVLTWILGYFLSLARGVSPRIEWVHARAVSSRAVAAVSRFPSRGSRGLEGCATKLGRSWGPSKSFKQGTVRIMCLSERSFGDQLVVDD